MNLLFLRLRAIAILVVFGGPVALSHAADRPPNVVLIISDDQTYTDFGFMGNRDVVTPNLDKLARASAVFPNGSVPSSVCRPSLVTLLTGLYPHQHLIHFNHPPPGFGRLTRNPHMTKKRFDALRQKAAVLIHRVPSLPRQLARQGYRSLQTGKYWEGHWRNAGFTEGMTIAEPSGGANGDKLLANGEIVAHGNGDHGLAIGRQTMQPIYDFIDSCGQTPFLVWYAPFLPHTPHDAPQKYRDLYKQRTGIAQHKLPYYASISQFDDTVGDLVAAVEKRGLAKDTIFVFVVDNGWRPDARRYNEKTQEWDHTKRSKRAPFEDGLRTPVLIRWDGQIKPRRVEQLVSTIDIVPTLLRAAGVDASKLQRKLPGIDLMPVARGQRTIAEDRAVFGEIYPGDATALENPSGDVAYRWVRQGKFKLIVPHRQRGKPPWNNYLRGQALFQVATDPGELRDLSGMKEHTVTMANLRRLLDGWWTP